MMPILKALKYEPETGEFTWLSGKRAGCARPDGYVKIRYKGEAHYAHRLAWLFAYGEWPSKQIDHVDRNPRNNALSNLREVTNEQNSFNGSGPKPGKSGFKGVVWHKRDRVWKVQVRNKGKRISGGTYRDAEIAARAYDALVLKLRGEYAVTNFPEIRT